MKQTGKLNPIPENVIKIIIQRELDRKVSNGEVPVGTIFTPTVYCKLIYFGTITGEPIPYRWKVGYRMKTPDNLEKNLIITANPFFGYLTGIIAVNSFDGSELEHRDIMMVYPETYVSKSVEEEKTEK